MPIKDPGRTAKVRIKTYVNGQLQRSDIKMRKVYQTNRGWRMWDSDSGTRVQVEKVDGRNMFEWEKHMSVPGKTTGEVLMDELRKSA